jgi:hypothetical protein
MVSLSNHAPTAMRGSASDPLISQSGRLFLLGFNRIGIEAKKKKAA